MNPDESALVADIRVQAGDFDLSTEVAAMRDGNPGIGAVASFIGTVRDLNDGATVTSMQLEHYPGMTEKSLSEIAGQAATRWSLEAVTIIHRVGALAPGDQIVLVAVASAHRGDAFAACEFIMDFLKTRAPFWKKEVGSGGERWVDARETDSEAAMRWLGAQSEQEPKS